MSLQVLQDTSGVQLTVSLRRGLKVSPQRGQSLQGGGCCSSETVFSGYKDEPSGLHGLARLSASCALQRTMHPGGNLSLGTALLGTAPSSAPTPLETLAKSCSVHGPLFLHL